VPGTVRDELIDHGWAVLDEIGFARSEGGHRVGRGEIAQERDPRRLDAVATQHRLHAEPGGRRASERNHRPADQVRPSEAGSRFAAQEEEPVTIVRPGEVDEA